MASICIVYYAISYSAQYDEKTSSFRIAARSRCRSYVVPEVAMSMLAFMSHVQCHTRMYDRHSLVSRLVRSFLMDVRGDHEFAIALDVIASAGCCYMICAILLQSVIYLRPIFPALITHPYA